MEKNKSKGIKATQSDNITDNMPTNAKETINKEVEQARFTRSNNLIEEGVWEAPIVYSSNFGKVKVQYGDEENDYQFSKEPPLIRKQDQYGYTSKDATPLHQDEFDKEFDEVTQKELSNGMKVQTRVELPKSNTVDFLTEQQKFDARWEEIKKQALKDNEDTKIVE